MRCHWIIRLCAVAFLSVGVSSAQAAIDRQVTIQPILVYNDATGGAKLASAGGLVVFFEEEADKIWAQAGMDVEFLTPASLDNPTFVDLDNAAEFLALTTGAGNGQSSDPLVVNMWFVDDIWGGAFGVAWLSENGIAIANDTFQWDLAHHPEGRIDTIAHELGHNLGLGHWTGTNAANHLMADGGIRNVASDLAHILINGTDPSTGGPELLTPDEIAVARGSPFARDLDAVPEPATFLLWSGFGAMALVVGWRRRQGVL